MAEDVRDETSGKGNDHDVDRSAETKQAGPSERVWTRRAVVAGLVPSAALVGAGLTKVGPLTSPPKSPPGEPAAGPGLNGQGLNVRHFGATGDGKTDDGPAIQRAFDKAHTSGVGVVIIPPGTYRIGTALKAVAPIRIAGIGGWSGTTLVFDSTLSTGLLFEQATTAVVYPGPAMQLVNLGVSYGGDGAAVELNESNLSSPFQDTLISGCRFEVGGSGVGILTVNQRDAIITQCQFLGSNSHAATGIELSDSDNTKIEDNVFYNLLYGIHGHRAPNRVFDAGCLITGNSMYGFVDAIHMEGWELVQAIGNIVDGATGNCFHMIDCYHSILSDNYLGVNGAASGLLIETKQPYGVGFLGQINVRGNYINHYSGASGMATIAIYGVSATLPEDQILVDGNTVNGYPVHGVHLRNAQNVMIRGNVFSAAASGSTTVFDETPGKNHILDNIVDGAIVAPGDTLSNNFPLYSYPT